MYITGVMATKTVAVETKEFAVIQTGGKQYIVSEGDTLKIEKIIGDHKVGDSITFSDVLLVDDGSNTTIGTPTIPGAQVSAEIQKIAKAKKWWLLNTKRKVTILKSAAIASHTLR